MTTSVTASPLTIEIRREGEAVHYLVQNKGTETVWAWLLGPEVGPAGLRLSTAAAWSAMEGDTLVLRLAQAEIPEEVDAEPLNSGAVPLEPGARAEGELPVAVPYRLRAPYGRPAPGPVVPKRVRVEVGYAVVPKPPALLEWEGLRFAYVDPASLPGGQLLARSAEIEWEGRERSQP